jgi:hypothetical protein
MWAELIGVFCLAIGVFLFITWVMGMVHDYVHSVPARRPADDYVVEQARKYEELTRKHEQEARDLAKELEDTKADLANNKQEIHRMNEIINVYKKFPNLRFGQFIDNIISIYKIQITDTLKDKNNDEILFYISNETLIEAAKFYETITRD